MKDSFEGTYAILLSTNFIEGTNAVVEDIVKVENREQLVEHVNSVFERILNEQTNPETNEIPTEIDRGDLICSFHSTGDTGVDYIFEVYTNKIDKYL